MRVAGYRILSNPMRQFSRGSFNPVIEDFCLWTE